MRWKKREEQGHELSDTVRFEANVMRCLQHGEEEQT